MKNPNNFLKQKKFALKTSAIFQMFQALKNAFVLKNLRKIQMAKLQKNCPFPKLVNGPTFALCFQNKPTNSVIYPYKATPLIIELAAASLLASSLFALSHYYQSFKVLGLKGLKVPTTHLK